MTLDEARFEEDFYVPADAGLTLIQDTREVGYSQLAVTQEFQNA